MLAFLPVSKARTNIFLIFRQCIVYVSYMLIGNVLCISITTGNMVKVMSV
jgi:hypothetical protein